MGSLTESQSSEDEGSSAYHPHVAGEAVTVNCAVPPANAKVVREIECVYVQESCASSTGVGEAGVASSSLPHATTVSARRPARLLNVKESNRLERVITMSPARVIVGLVYTDFAINVLLMSPTRVTDLA